MDSNQSENASPPLDAALNPEALWENAVYLSNNHLYKEAAWCFLVALFMDFSLDAKDLTPVITAIENCDRNDPVAVALDSIRIPQSQVQRSRENYLRASRMHCDPVMDNSTTIDEVGDAYRHAFGIGMCGIIHARCKRQMAMREARRNPPPDKAVFREIAQIVNDASVYINPERWITIQ